MKGKLHREDGPAVIAPIDIGSYKHEWYKHGQLHRVDGSAVIYPDGREEYWFDNKKYSYEDWFIKTNPIAAELFIF